MRLAHSSLASGPAKPWCFGDVPMSRWSVFSASWRDRPLGLPRSAPGTLDAAMGTEMGSKMTSRRSGTAAMSANVSYMLKVLTRSQIGSQGPRPSTPASPPQKVFLNHVASQRDGSPIRAAPSSAGLAARFQSCSIDVRCAVRSRQPIGDPVFARPS